ncbi:hypothetical protein GGH12_002709 [Coemansia sp. RSA 1822]|nr:hypothetical protein LPJ76_003549 [Coemansia sp. RSA 638]KAJ2541696.1 hypothetical protein GGF49_003438 [Coemansia sp. RSA 1853]KAJ2563215.1 hypothetical protein GGH12_002709 [Coemansia sp. RSA 1822]
MTTSTPPTEGEACLLRLNSAIKKLALAQAEHNEWKSALPAIQEDMNDQLVAGKAEMEATFATAHKKYAALTAGAQTFIRETEQKGMDLEVKSEQLEAEVQACMAEACLEYQATRVNVAPALKGKAKPTLADIVGQPKATEEAEQDPQKAEKEWKEFRKAAMPPAKPAVTWDNSTSKAPAKLTAEQMEEAAVFHQDSNWANCNGLAIIAVAIPGNRELERGVSSAREGMAKHLPYKIRMYNISKLTDQCVEVLILEQHATEACYCLCKAKYVIFKMPQPCYKAQASQHQFEPQLQLTLNRWKYEAEQAKTSEAKSYYQSLIEDYSDLLEQQKNSEEGPLMDPMLALAACQDTGSQHRCPASQMDAEKDSTQAAPAKHHWEAVNAPADGSEDCPATDSSETEKMAGDTAKTVSNAMDMDQDSSYNTGGINQNGLIYA